MPEDYGRCRDCRRPTRFSRDGRCYRCRGNLTCPVCRGPSGRGRRSWCAACAVLLVDQDGPRPPAGELPGLLALYMDRAARMLPLFDRGGPTPC